MAATIADKDKVTKEIRDEVMDETRKLVERKCGVGGKKVVSIAHDVLMVNMADYVDVDDYGVVTPKSFRDLSRKKTKLIKKIRERRVIKSTPEGDQIMESTLDFELYNFMEAAKFLSDLAGWKAAEKHEVTHRHEEALEELDD